MENTTTTVIVDDVINLQGAPHTVCEISRESLSTVPEKAEEEIYAQPEEPAEEDKGTTPEPPQGGNEEV